MTGGGCNSLYGYSAAGERVGMYDSVVGGTTYILRGLDDKPLRQYLEAAGVWSWKKDWVYRDGQLLATVEPSGTKYFHLDHLGTPRRITNSSRTVIASHDYYPFGEEVTGSTPDGEVLKFTGHERDLRDTTKTTDDLDYMHARYHNPNLARFLTVDPHRAIAFQSSDDEDDQDRFAEFIRSPGNWNGYSYARNNPIQYVDPGGKNAVATTVTVWTITGGGAAVTAPMWVGPAVVSGAGAGAVYGAYRLGTWAPVSEPLTSVFETVLDLTVFHAQNTRQTRAVVDGLLANAAAHLGKIASAGGPDQDPDFNKHKQEIKAVLERALRLAQRLPKRQERAIREVIFKVAESAGVTL